jgi:hypothetical protein
MVTKKSNWSKKVSVRVVGVKWQEKQGGTKDDRPEERNDQRE